MEEISNSFSGVDYSFAIQAGREIRIIVKPGIDDVQSAKLARDVRKEIENKMDILKRQATVT